MEVPDEHDSFRDRSATIDEQGKRKWVFAYKPRGRFYSARTLLSYLYLLLFFWIALYQIQRRAIFTAEHH